MPSRVDAQRERGALKRPRGRSAAAAAWRETLGPVHDILWTLYGKSRRRKRQAASAIPADVTAKSIRKRRHGEPFSTRMVCGEK